MNEVLKSIGDLGIVPVVKIDDAKDAVPLGRALLEGGLPVAEITFRTAAAEEAIKNISRELPDILVGAGTVLSVDQVKRAVDAGAKFIVSPGFNPSVVKYCVDNDIPITPGCSSPTDIEMALGFGLEVVKFFPAESLGGIDTLKAISAPYGMMKFIPTGGINASNINQYLAFNKVLACGGSWMVKDELIKNGNFEEITRLTREAVNIMLGFDLAHVGINMPDAESSLEVARKFATIFNLPLKEGNSSNFAGTGIEVNKSMGLGKNGHIAIKTNSISRAIAYLERNGIAVDMSTAKGSAGGPIVAVYLKEEIGGFAIHLLQNK
ncbi:MAG: bifunctional 4-hydroxy-2-oxoglutarate aldolase/2-dehydro-3-deoxy-phosphogluconate aldolase [Firmicutes bacterium]|nr:bifunctional 4-hydroxy-2-oxoglutarate aldolase/2-dehydro-3-deoxy-phosphogluconate aldolase [Bacillota bacterium]